MTRHAGTNDDLLAMALVGYEGEKARIDAAIREIQAQLGHRGPGRPRATTDGTAPKKRTMSAAARRRIGAAQRKRWAAVKRSQARVKGVAKAAAPKKRKLSAAARKKMGDAARKRWAAQRKAARKKTKPVAKVGAKPAAAAAS